jgi:hypothetical protein
MRLIARALSGLVVILPGALLPVALLMTGPTAFAQRAHGGSGGHVAASPSGFRSFTPHPAPPPAPHPQHGRTAVVPYPVYHGGYYYGNYYYYGGDYSQQPAPAYDYGLADAPGQSPVAIINQGYVPDRPNPVMRDYSNADLPPPGPDYQTNDQPTIYLLAMTDHTIIPAIAYWVDGDTLNYITTEGSQNRVSLSLIDREFSRQLNDSRNVEFKLPPAK